MNSLYARPGSVAKPAMPAFRTRFTLPAEPDRVGMLIAVTFVLLTLLGMTVALAVSMFVG